MQKSEWKFWIIMFLFPLAAFAADPSAAVDGVTAKVNDFMVGGFVVVLGGVVDFIFRLIPTKNPLSIAWLIRNVLFAVSKLLEAVAKAMDKILPQVVKPADPPADQK